MPLFCCFLRLSLFFVVVVDAAVVFCGGVCNRLLMTTDSINTNRERQKKNKMKGFPYWDFTRRCNTVIIIIDTVGVG